MVRVEKEGKSTYYFTNPVRLAKGAFSLSPKEAEALLVAERFLPSFEGTPLKTHFKSAVAKIIKANMGQHKLDTKKTMARYFIGHIPYCDFAFSDVFERIDAAIEAKTSLKIEYYTYTKLQDNKFVAEEKVIEPYVFVYNNYRWYVLAYCLDKTRTGFVLLALARIKSMRQLHKKFKPRSKELKRFLNAQKRKSSRSVEVRISPKIAPYLYEMKTFANSAIYSKGIWKKELFRNVIQEAAMLPSNIKAKFFFNDFEWDTLADKYALEKWILGWGGDVTAYAPRELTERIFSVVSKMKDNYEAQLTSIRSNEVEAEKYFYEYEKDPEKTINHVIEQMEGNRAGKEMNTELRSALAEEVIKLLSGKSKYQPGCGTILQVLKQRMANRYHKDTTNAKVAFRYFYDAYGEKGQDEDNS